MTDSLFVATAAQHPVTPPLELVEQWTDMFSSLSDHAVFSLAARWGADQELEACLLWVGDGRRENLSQVIALRAARRPNPPTLKAQALEQYAHIERILRDHGYVLDGCVMEALEALDD